MPRIESVTAELLHDEALVNVIVRVRDSDGLEGVGEAWWGIHDAARPSRTGSPIIAVVNDMLAPRLAGRGNDRCVARGVRRDRGLAQCLRHDLVAQHRPGTRAREHL